MNCLLFTHAHTRNRYLRTHARACAHMHAMYCMHSLQPLQLLWHSLSAGFSGMRLSERGHTQGQGRNFRATSIAPQKDIFERMQAFSNGRKEVERRWNFERFRVTTRQHCHISSLAFDGISSYELNGSWSSAFSLFAGESVPQIA